MLGLSFPASAMLDSHLGIAFPLPFTLSGIGMLLMGVAFLVRVGYKLHYFVRKSAPNISSSQIG
jgi:hypothetical protein